MTAIKYTSANDFIDYIRREPQCITANQLKQNCYVLDLKNNRQYLVTCSNEPGHSKIMPNMPIQVEVFNDTEGMSWLQRKRFNFFLFFETDHSQQILSVLKNFTASPHEKDLVPPFSLATPDKPQASLIPESRKHSQQNCVDTLTHEAICNTLSINCSDENFTWYFDADTKNSFAPVRAQKHWVSRKESGDDLIDGWADIDSSYEPRAGGNLFIANKDEHFIELTLKPNACSFSKEEIAHNRAIACAVKPYQFLVPGIIVDRRTMITPNAGKEVYNDYIKYHKKIEVKQFESLSEDIKNLHTQQVFLRDIQPRNMAIKTINAQVKLFDLYTAMTPSSRNIQQHLGCRNYITAELLTGALTGCEKILLDADKYALLLSMMHATGTPLIARGIVNNSAKENKKLHDHKASRNDVKQWISRYVHTQYQGQVELFIQTPATHSLSNDLFDIINWQS